MIEFGNLFGKNIAIVSMKIKELTEAQGEKLCDYIFKKYGEYDENNILKTSINKVCMHCPYRVAVEDNWYECCLYAIETELDPELEEVIKND